MPDIIAIFALALIALLHLAPLLWSSGKSIGLEDPGWVRRQTRGIEDAGSYGVTYRRLR